MSDALVILGLVVLAFGGYLVVRRVRQQQNPQVPDIAPPPPPARPRPSGTPEAVTNALKHTRVGERAYQPPSVATFKKRPSARAVQPINEPPLLDPNPMSPLNPLSSLLHDSSSYHRHEPAHHHDPSPDPSPSYHSPDTGGGGYDGGGGEGSCGGGGGD